MEVRNMRININKLLNFQKIICMYMGRITEGRWTKNEEK